MENYDNLKVYYNNDINEEPIINKNVAILGFGSQGHAHAMNLSESGVKVKVGLREGSKSTERVRKAGIEPVSFEEAIKWADVIMVLLPDTIHKEIYETYIEPNLKEGIYLGFGHGFSIHYNEIVPPANVNTFIVAPKGPGHLVRSEYTKERGVPSLVAVGQNPSGNTFEVALAYAKCNGAGTAGIIETTFKNETETDLFGEQAVLCGGATALIKAGFETLTEAGYPPEMAYFECLHELKLIVDLIYYGGIQDMRYSISDTAKYGDVSRGPRIITDGVKAEMKKVLTEIQDGSFAKEWIEECRKGQPNLNQLLKADDDHEIEQIGRKLRGMMSWIKEKQLISADERK